MENVLQELKFAIIKKPQINNGIETLGVVLQIVYGTKEYSELMEEAEKIVKEKYADIDTVIKDCTRYSGVEVGDRWGHNNFYEAKTNKQIPYIPTTEECIRLTNDRMESIYIMTAEILRCLNPNSTNLPEIITFNGKDEICSSVNLEEDDVEETQTPEDQESESEEDDTNTGTSPEVVEGNDDGSDPNIETSDEPDTEGTGDTPVLVFEGDECVNPKAPTSPDETTDVEE